MECKAKERSRGIHCVMMPGNLQTYDEQCHSVKHIILHIVALPLLHGIHLVLGLNDEYKRFSCRQQLVLSII